MIKNKITRTVAGVICCLLVAVFLGKLTNVFINIQKQQRENYYPIYTVSDDINNIYYKLWAVGNMWLRNLDENGKFIGSEALEKQTVSALQELGCMDNKGNIVLNDTDDYEYFVSYGNNSFSNTSKKYEDFDYDYSMMRKNDSISYSYRLGYCYTNNDFNMYDTNYGMHYYYLSGKGIALYDFDTSGLNSYIDDLGATLYYKTDGSTPLPDEYYNFSYNSHGYNGYDYGEYTDIYDEYGNWIGNVPRDIITYSYYDENGHLILRETVPENDEDVPRETTPAYEDGVYVYLNDRFIRVEQEKFKTVQLKELPLTIAVQPNNEIIDRLENYYNDREESNKKAVLAVMNNVPLLIIAFVLLIFVLITGGYSVQEKKFVMSSLDRIFVEIPVALIFLSVVALVALENYIYDFYSFICDLYHEQVFYAICGIVCYIITGAIVLSLNSLVVRIKCHCFWKTTFIYTFFKTVWVWIKKIRNAIAQKFISRDMLRDDKFTRRFIVRTVAFGIAEFFCALLFFDWGAYGPFFFFSFILLAGYVALNLLDLSAMNRISKHITAINSGDYTPHTENKYSSAYCITQKLNNISAGIQSAVDRQVQSERMKIDLVTNVSHDLKTPLTSIISYIDLLSSEELTPEARDYVTIIENKSQRLKTMVADLFDLAKATSHTDVDMENIDAVILANQVLADLNDKIELTSKQLKVDIQADSAPIIAEGKKMYRVLQNIIDNALKYSLDGTRIYFTLRNENGYCTISVKNIASYEMNFSPDEIMERFTRGDQSRSTDGNGLGLSIAKSFTEACGGSFSITVDGDVFIAQVRMPIYIGYNADDISLNK